MNCGTGPGVTHHAACPCREAAQAERIERYERALEKVSQMAGAPDPVAACRACVVIARAALAGAKGGDRG